MSQHRVSARRFLLCAMIIVAFGTRSPAQRPRPAAAANPGADSPSPEDERERQAMERFLSLLERNPRRGTALDRVYGYHVERGTLDAFAKRFEDRVARDPKDGAGWMILGLLESQRGQDAAAIKAFGKAESARADDPMPPFYLGQSLVLIGRPEEAAAAYERALQRKPRRNDLLDIFQALGRVYQRGQKLDQALAVWGRLEQLFPGDQQVQEQVASALAEEGQAEPALARYERLAKSVRDPFRQAQLAMTAADLKVRLGRTEPALHDFESLLGKLRPDSWLYREVRRKIEDVFLRNDDQAGLAAYYERWTRQNPEDVEALVRLGRSLAAQGRVAEAVGWYEKAIKLAPSRRDLRLALIGQLAQDRKFADAEAQYEALDKAEPNNPDTLRDWGGLVLRDTSKPEAARKAAAAAIWRKLIEAKPKDPVTVAQVADLFRQAEMTDDALALYRQAIALAPNDAQYHEYLGEYLHALKRPDEALAAWGRIAEGSNRNAKSLARLAEVLSGFGYIRQAIPPMTQALELDRDNFDLGMKLAGLLHRAERYDDARARLVATEKLAESDEEKAAALEAQVKNDQAAGQLAARAEAMSRELEAGGKGTAAAWARLARYLEADGKLPEAGRAISKAIEADPRSVPAWALAGRIRESAGNLADAAESFRRLAEIDRRNRTEYLTQVAKLEARLGRIDQAIKAGRDLIAAAPGNPEHYEFFAQLCFQLGKPDDGLDALRRAVRVNPNDTKILTTLAETLGGQFRIDEAIEMYWRSYEKSEGLDDRLGMVTRLTSLYLQRNQLDRLLARLQRERAESPQKQREASICLAQAYAGSGDLGMARSELERLLSANPRDTQLLQQLSKLAEEEGDVEGAAKHQKQLVELAPSDEGQLRLAQLYVRHGDVEEAQHIWTRMAMDQKDEFHKLQAVDRLLGSNKPAAVLEVAGAMVRKDPHDWEALYREAIALAELGKREDAAQRFHRLLGLRRGDDDKSAAARAFSRDPKLQATAGAPASSTLRRGQTLPLQDRINVVYQVRRVTRLENEIYYGTATTSTVWTPADFGQARIAALGWLVALARAEGKVKEDALLAEFRSTSRKNPPDPRALWDWYYLNLVLSDNTGTYEAARALSRATPSDPMAMWVYLTSLGSRQFGQGPQYYVAPGTETTDGTPPLPSDEIDHVLACYRALRQRRPELAAQQVLPRVAVELKRAKRADAGEALYREVLDGAHQVDEVAGALGLAAERGDVEGLIALFDRYERLQAGRSPAAFNYYFEGPAYSMSQAMNVRAKAKAYGDVLRLLDHYLADARRKHEQGGAARGRSNNFGNPYAAGNTPNYRVWVGRSPRNVVLTFPLPNEYYDYGAIAMLRTAYELYKAGDLSSDLAAHFRKQAEAARTPPDALYPRLALSYLAWWEDDKDAAVAEFARVADTSPPESSLRLDLADLQEKRGEPAEALAVLDAFTPLDNAATRRREEQALRLAIATGNIDRARQAAERLFGLRMDTDAQVRLAGQMHQLGQHELAEAVLGRARQRAGNKASALVALMLQYQRQDKVDAAVQAALQILQGTTAMHTSSPYVYNPNDTDAARTSAIQVLARSGRLKGIIERAEEQLKRTPNAIQLHQALADYYKAAGQRDKARAELTRIADLRPDDASLRLQVANQLLQENQVDAALVHFKTALKKDPSVAMRSYYEIENAFRRAKKSEELIELLEQSDLRRFGQYFYVMNTVQNLMNDPAMRDRAMGLFRKTWEAFPQQRANLMSYVHRNEFWQMPEMYDYALQALIPDGTSASAYQQWNAFGRIISYSSGGKVNSMVGHLLDMAAAQNKLDDLSRRIDDVRKKVPGWKAGGALQALIDCRAARYDEAERLIQDLLKERDDDRVSADAFWIIGNELENYASMKALALRVYENCVGGESLNPNRMLNFQFSPMKRLVNLYVRDGRRDDARRVLLEVAKPGDYPNYPEEYISQMRLQALSAAAAQLAEIGFPADAIPLYNEALAAADAIPPGGPNYVGNLAGLGESARRGLDQALQGLNDEQLVQTIRGLIEPPAEAGGTAKGETRPKPSAAKGRDQAIDLVLLVHPRDLDKAAIRSLFADSVAAGARDRKLLAAIDEPLKSLREKHPDDLSVRIGAALAALAEGDPGRAREALDRLRELVDRTPLEPLPQGAHANTRQRAEAARQVPLWLVARACWKKDASREDGDRFAARAVEAARRQSDTRWLMAMLREQGQSALDRGDTRQADEVWGRMLDLVLARKPEKPGAAAAPPGAAPPAAVARANPAATAPGTARAPARPRAVANVPILTLDRFEQAMQVALLAADKGLTALAARALREALKGGPPVVVAAQPTGRTRVVRSRAGVMEPADEITPRVIAQLVELERTWQHRRAPAGPVYEALRDVAMPEGRPGEVFVYAQTLAPATMSRPRSLGAMLADWAVRAGQADDLRKKIESRRRQPLAEFPATILSAQLAMAGGDTDRANRELRAVVGRLQRDTLRPTTDLAGHVALPALERTETRAAALDVLDACIKSQQTTDTPEPLRSLLLVVARRQLKGGDVAGGRKHLEDYLEANDRSTVRYSGDYPLYLRKQALRTIAAEYARAGLGDELLRALGDYVDAPSSRDYGVEPSVADLLAGLAGQLASRPAAERYRVLKEWTMPTPKRRMVRILSSAGSNDRPPAAFLKQDAARVPDEVFSTATALIEAAREVGALDALADEARAAAGEKLENAEGLLLLVDTARGRGDAIRPRLESRVLEIVKEVESQPDATLAAGRVAAARSGSAGFPWTDYLLARAALERGDPATRAAALRLLEALVKRAQRLQDHVMLARLHGDLAAARARLANSPAVADRLDGGLAHWHPSSTVPSYYLTAGLTPSRWVAHRGHIAHLAGPGNDYLLFDYPLTGTFELSFEAYHGPWAEANLSYGGLDIQPFWQGAGSSVSSIGSTDAINRPWRLVRSGDFNKITIQVAPDKVRYLVNGHLFHEDDDPSPTSPWLALYTQRERQTAWRNLAIRGEPTIPRTVRLSHRDRLDGWVTGFYNETQPARLTTIGVDENGNTRRIPKRPGAAPSASASTPVDPDAFDWCSVDGVIRGRRSTANARPAARAVGDDTVAGQSRLYYYRPLRDGDALSYEFFYEPDQVMVHPALDRLAFLLEPDGVRLHWMTLGALDPSGFPADNVADEPENRRGPARLPLKPGEWNAMKLELIGGRLALQLNGATIYERALEPENSRQFGLYHDKERTAAQVRNVELRGRWPEALPAAARADLAALEPSAPNGEADRHARQAMIGEDFFSLEADAVLARARKLDPEERYKLLADWVLPNADHAGYRLRGDFAPSDPAPPLSPAKPDRPGIRLESGGELRAPAIELIAAASALGRSRLDELAARIEKAPAEDDHDRRSRLALLALIAMERGEDDKAAASLEQMKSLVEKLSPGESDWRRWPDLTAAARAIERPRTRPAALALLEAMVDWAHNKGLRTVWAEQVSHLRARARLRDELGPGGSAFGTDPEVRDWARVTQGSAQTRGEGHPMLLWTYRDGQFTHHPGHADDMLYLRAPLRGEFQVDCELAILGWREIRLAYGGLTVAPKYDSKHVERHHFSRQMADVPLNPPLNLPGGWYKYRLVVKKGSMTSFVNGRQIHQAPLPPECDPWLALQCAALNTGVARHITISGRPAIPEQLNLSALPDLTGWLPEYYGESSVGNNANWEKQGEEIVGRLRDDFPGSKQESVLFYNRPMLEDGEIAYEFFYEPGKAVAHPALDRLAFLLEPDGVKVHRLTDAQYERNGLSPDNVAVEPENRRGPASLPLKAREWNRLALRLSGDRVALRLNGQLIYERALEATNQRSFGLFHYADEAEVRVRKVIYRGEWPRALPDQLMPRQEGHGEERTPR